MVEGDSKWRPAAKNDLDLAIVVLGIGILQYFIVHRAFF